MRGKRSKRRARRRAQAIANLTGMPQRVVCDNANGHYRITGHWPTRATKVTLRRDNHPDYLASIHHKGSFAGPRKRQRMPYYSGGGYGFVVWPNTKD